MSDVANPYSVPKSAVADIGPNMEAEAAREMHLSTEASIRSVGMLYYLAFAGCAFAGIFVFALPGADAVGGPLELVMLLAFSAAFAAVGYGLRALKPAVRIPAIVLSVLGLLAFPVGTLIHAYVLYLLLCAKGKFLFTPEYAQIVGATPHLRYRTSPIVRAVMIVALVGIAAAIVVPMVSR